ncbi:helix-turn-helix domain-containing protein [candidate division KSB1 bacterium]
MHLSSLPSQKDLSNMSGTSRETISRVLKVFIKEGMITKSKNNLYINNYEEFKQKFG